MRTLVTGGAGYIGSAVAEELLHGGHEVVVYDNLAKGHRDAVPPGATFVHGDLGDAQLLPRRCARARKRWSRQPIPGRRVDGPARYYANNVGNGLALLDAI
jgi:UDP-glucose 4-epimerase